MASIALALVQNLLLVFDSTLFGVILATSSSAATPTSLLSDRRLARSLARSGKAEDEPPPEQEGEEGWGALVNSSLLPVAAPDDWTETYALLRPTLGGVQIFTCLVSVIVHFTRSVLRKSFLELLKRTSSAYEHEGGDIRPLLRLVSRPLHHPAFFLRFLTRLLYVAATDVEFLRKLTFLVCAILGATWDEEYFVVLLFQVVFANKDLLDVMRAGTDARARNLDSRFRASCMRASPDLLLSTCFDWSIARDHRPWKVTQNGKQLLLTVLLLMIVLWAYAVWGVAMVRDGGGDYFHGMCNSLGECWLNIVDSIASGDLLSLLTVPHTVKSSPPMFANLYLYHFSFFVVVQSECHGIPINAACLPPRFNRIRQHSKLRRC